jgi:hypothetical protein
MTTSTRRSRTLLRVRAGLALAAAGVLLAACGSSSKGASGSVGNVGTSPSTSTSSKAASGGGGGGVNLGGGSFCDKAKQASANVSSAAESLSTNTPDKIKTFEQNAIDELKALKDQAPQEIKGAIGTIADAETTLFNDLSAANFDFSKVSSQITTQFSAPAFTQAIQQVQSYLVTKCGLNPSAIPS